VIPEKDKVYITIDGTKYWYDPKEHEAQRIWYEEKNKELCRKYAASFERIFKKLAERHDKE
jgi:hypothetical protein